jgi:c-di-AMP phosphodiesterase-like protein
MKRRMILWYININWLIMLGFFIATVWYIIPLRTSFAIILTLLLLAYTFFTIFVLITFTNLTTKRWFDTQEQLDDEISRQKYGWQRANKFIKIIGEHEAIKMWNQNKDKEEENGKEETP